MFLADKSKEFETQRLSLSICWTQDATETLCESRYLLSLHQNKTGEKQRKDWVFNRAADDVLVRQEPMCRGSKYKEVKRGKTDVGSMGRSSGLALFWFYTKQNKKFKTVCVLSVILTKLHLSRTNEIHSTSCLCSSVSPPSFLSSFSALYLPFFLSLSFTVVADSNLHAIFSFGSLIMLYKIFLYGFNLA